VASGYVVEDDVGFGGGFVAEGGCPALPSFVQVGTVEAGFDFDTVEDAGVVLEVACYVRVSGESYRGIDFVGLDAMPYRSRTVVEMHLTKCWNSQGCAWHVGPEGDGMSKQLDGKKIAILATDGFEQVELTDPKKNLEAEGAKVTVLSIKPGEGGRAGEIKGWDKTDWGKTVKVDGLVYDAKSEEFDALVLPGGQINPDKLRMDKGAVAFVKAFAESGKPVAAICHGPWTLIEADVVKGKTMTSWPSVSTDLKNAGAHWVDKEVVVDGNLITSRKPEDIPAFSKAIVEAVAKASRHNSAG
jgi:protease I